MSTRPQSASPFTFGVDAMFKSLICLGLLSTLAACQLFGLSEQDRTTLASFQSNAKYWWEGRHYDRALRAVSKGLEIDGDNYALLQIRAWVFLAQAENNRDYLARAEPAFDRLWGLRSADEHPPRTLLGLADCHKQIGLSLARKAQRLELEASAPTIHATAKVERLAQAAEAKERAEHHLGRAKEALDLLLEREEQLRWAHKHLMDIATERKDYAGAVEHGRLCLERLAKLKTETDHIIATTTSARFEAEQYERRRGLLRQEMKVRSALAEMHFRKGFYELAIAQYDSILAYDKQRWVVYYHRACAHERLGHAVLARRDYTKFLTTHDLPRNDKRVRKAFEYTQQ